MRILSEFIQEDSKMKEVWKAIPNTNNNYLISNLGNVKSRYNKYRHSAGGYIWRYANDRNS